MEGKSNEHFLQLPMLKIEEQSNSIFCINSLSPSYVQNISFFIFCLFFPNQSFFLYLLPVLLSFLKGSKFFDEEYTMNMVINSSWSSSHMYSKRINYFPNKTWHTKSYYLLLFLIKLNIVFVFYLNN